MTGRHQHPGTRPRAPRSGILLAGTLGRALPRRASPGPVLIALAALLLLDRLQFARGWPTVVVGALDEPAHLLTTWLALAALAPRAGARLRAWALVGSVVIDLDHVPFFLGWQPIVSPVGRPVTHSLTVVVGVLLLAAVPVLRRAALALAAGVLSHLARDLATGPGVPLLWPLSPDGWTVPYGAYVACLVLAAAVALVRAVRGARPGPPEPAPYG